MRKFVGQFKDLNDKDVYVTITPDSYTEEVEIKFPYDEPVIIENNTSSVFESVRTTSCTIKIFTEEIYWDLYTPSATGYKVKVERENIILFSGFLTPCVYTQDYLYKSVLELEAVDYLAVLDQFKYKLVGNDTEIITIDELLKRCFSSLNISTYENRTDLDFTQYYIQESNFFDDDNEPMTCKEILEELFNYLGFSIVSYNGSFTIYKVQPETQPETLLTEKYGAGNPTIDIDNVYNKISIGCNLYEVEDLTTDFFDNNTIFNEVKLTSNNQIIYSDYFFSWREHGHHTEDKNRYHLYVKPYNFVDETIDTGNVGKWKSTTRQISDLSLQNDSATVRANKDTLRYKDSQGKYLYVPQYIGAQPIRVFEYSNAEGINNKKSISWKDYIIFPSVTYANYQDRFTRTVYPALTYKSNDNLAYSIKDGTGYIVLDLSVFCQSDIGNKGVDTEVIWAKAYLNGKEETIAVPLPMDNVGLTFDKDIQTFLKRKTDATDYNTGWQFIKCKVKVGNKYWNGTQWTTADSTFNLSFHDQDAAGNEETFSYFKWLELVPNQNIPQYNVGEDGYAIPITAADKLNGKFELEIYTPKPFKYAQDRIVLGDLVTGQDIKEMRVCNNYFVKDLSVKYVYKDSHHWADDKEIENDIIYENIINDSYAIEMSELDLKINSWYKDKPISKSYLLDKDKLPVTMINGKVQEDRLLEMYYNHYSTPKKIMNLNYHTLDVNPTKSYYHLPTNTTFNIMAYNMNVKTNETDYKLIQI